MKKSQKRKLVGSWKLKKGLDLLDLFKEYSGLDETQKLSNFGRLNYIFGRLDNVDGEASKELMQRMILFGIYLSENDLIHTFPLTKEIKKENTLRSNMFG